MTSCYDEPIAALATPEGPGALAMVRVSGTGSWDLLRCFFSPTTPWHAGQPVPGCLRWRRGAPTVPALLLPFRRHASYTGEEACEIYLPGCPPLLRRFQEELRVAGVRPAQPGEFTRRAYLNGKLDLSAAESVAELIASEDATQARLIRRTLEGQLARQVEELGSALHDLVALLEAGLDFSEQEVEPPSGTWLLEQLRPLLAELETLLEAPSSQVREQARVRLLLWGRANAGKSTLFNRLVGHSRAITSATAGTTRDPVSARIRKPGWPELEVVDLAGERQSQEPVEEAALSLGRGWLHSGDAILYLLDGTRPNRSLQEEWHSLPSQIQAVSWPILSKCDLTCASPPEPIPGSLACSALTGEGVEALWLRIEEHVRRGSWTSRGETYLFTERQRGHLRDCARELQHLSQTLSKALSRAEVQAELVVVDLRLAHSHLEEITGAITTEETLDRIFRRFCLGK